MNMAFRKPSKPKPKPKGWPYENDPPIKAQERGKQELDNEIDRFRHERRNRFNSWWAINSEMLKTVAMVTLILMCILGWFIWQAASDEEAKQDCNARGGAVEVIHNSTEYPRPWVCVGAE
jgi:hypothetical protein